MPSAYGTFEVTPGGEETLHESGDGPTLTHATGTQRFTGDLQADGAVDWLMCYLPDRSATLVGLQRIDGSLAGRTGTFVMQAVGGHDGTGSRAIWTVVPGSGTNGFAGIRGEGSFDAAGGRTVTYALEYRFD